MAIFVTLHREQKLVDGAKHAMVCKTIPPGRHELERVRNPRGNGDPWLVIKGTSVGRVVNAWLEWPPDVLVIEEDGKIVPQIF